VPPKGKLPVQGTGNESSGPEKPAQPKVRLEYRKSSRVPLRVRQGEEVAELAARVRVELEKAGLHAVVYRKGEIP
jgi:transcriptional regulator